MHQHIKKTVFCLTLVAWSKTQTMNTPEPYKTTNPSRVSQGDGIIEKLQVLQGHVQQLLARNTDLNNENLALRQEVARTRIATQLTYEEEIERLRKRNQELEANQSTLPNKKVNKK